MKLVAAPLRQMRTYSMMLLIATGVFDLAVVLIKTMTDIHVIGAETALLINAGMVFLTGVVRLIAQQIPASTAEKHELVAQAAEQPVKAGQPDVDVKVVQQAAPKPSATSVRAYIDTELDERFEVVNRQLAAMRQSLDSLSSQPKEQT